MKKSFGEWLDEKARQHPCLSMLTVILLGVIATLLLLSTNQGPVVLYQAF